MGGEELKSNLSEKLYNELYDKSNKNLIEVIDLLHDTQIIAKKKANDQLTRKNEEITLLQERIENKLP